MQEINCGMKHIYILLILFSIGKLPAQSGWTRPQHGLFIKLDYSTLTGNKYYDAENVQYTTPDFKQTSINLYAEYGLTDRWTFMLFAPAYKSNQFENTESANGLGDLRFESKYRLTSHTLPIAFSLGVELPTGKKHVLVNATDGSMTTQDLPLGAGALGLHATLAISKSYHRMYGSVFTAYQYRSKFEGQDLLDAFSVGLEWGYQIIDPLWFNVKMRSQFRAGNWEGPTLNFLRNHGTTYTLLSGEFYYRILNHWGITATYIGGGEIFTKFRNVYANPMLSLGVIYQME